VCGVRLRGFKWGGGWGGVGEGGDGRMGGEDEGRLGGWWGVGI